MCNFYEYISIIAWKFAVFGKLCELHTITIGSVITITIATPSLIDKVRVTAIITIEIALVIAITIDGENNLISR